VMTPLGLPGRIRPRWADAWSAQRATEGPPGPGEFLVIVHAAGQLDDGRADGYWTEVPALSGCASGGETLAEALESTRGAIQGWLNRGSRADVEVKLRVDLAY
jgi:predicted RNase H-like HicB family nuclease